jgi:hypothetical protein
VIGSACARGWAATGVTMSEIFGYSINPVLSSDFELDARLEELELWLQEPVDIWRILVIVTTVPPTMLAHGAIQVQEWMRDRFPLVHFKISEAGSEAWITCFSAYPDDCENLAEEIRTSLWELLGCPEEPARQLDLKLDWQALIERSADT